VAVKVLSDQAVHKSDHGLVELDVTSSDIGTVAGRLRQRADRLGITDAQVVVQPMAQGGLELFVGISRDEVFGPVLIVGLGGTTVELFRDVVRRLGRVSPADVLGMVSELQCAPLLNGFRGGPTYDLDRFACVVATVSELAEQVPQIVELDLNPVLVQTDGTCTILDARMTVDGSIETAADPDGSLAPRDLTTLFRPRSVAVVGASRDESRPGNKVLRYLNQVGYGGPIYPVNPSGGEIAGRTAYASLSDIPEVPDLTCIALSADAAVEAARDAVGRGVPALIVLASGFSESGAVGARREQLLRNAIAGSGSILCGPNTIGIVNADENVAVTFSQGIEDSALIGGGPCLVAQSGAVAGSLVSRELTRGYGIGCWVTVGNQTDLDLADYVNYLAGQPTTRSIAVFLEGIENGGRLRRALQRARDSAVPVVVFKTGVSEHGGRAVAAHSGALAGTAEVYEAVFAQDGVVQVETMSALLETAWVLGNAPRPTGNRIAIVTTSGGAGSATVDLVDHFRLEMAELADDTAKKLVDILPVFARASNPLDVTAEGAFTPGLMRNVITELGQDPGVDIICVALTSLAGADARRIAQEIADAAASLSVPVLVTWLIAYELAADGMKILAANRIRVFDEPARMVSAIARLVALVAHAPDREPMR
jgi:acyl-CoA synthetase (NDP forming)